MSKVNVSLFIDRYHPNKDGQCRVSIKVTHLRKRRYYSTRLSLEPEYFDKLLMAKRLSKEQSYTLRILESYKAKANEIITKLPVFTFIKFEEMYFSNRDAVNSVSQAFEEYAKELRAQGRIGTAVSYEVAINSLENFRSGLKFADITPELLSKYENWMLQNGRSNTTIGIYLRSLRTLFNRANIDKSLYPFGNGKGKYLIPTGRNMKKALKLEEVAKIFNYKVGKGSTEQMAKDYWMFIYLCNGLNVKDLCLLKQKNIDGDTIRYVRAKTIRSKRESEEVLISLKPEAKAIIERWGVKNIYPEAFIFPHLNDKMDAERERKVIQQLTKTINKYVKRIAKKVGINKPVTTYYARHSFATILRNSGISTEFISDALGHSNIKTTQNYLAGFEEEIIHKNTDVLLNFPLIQEAN